MRILVATGRLRFRRSWRGKQILQIEKIMANVLVPPEELEHGEPQWFDANERDVWYLQNTGALPKN